MYCGTQCTCSACLVLRVPFLGLFERNTKGKAPPFCDKSIFNNSGAREPSVSRQVSPARSKRVSGEGCAGEVVGGEKRAPGALTCCQASSLQRRPWSSSRFLSSKRKRTGPLRGPVLAPRDLIDSWVWVNYNDLTRPHPKWWFIWGMAPKPPYFRLNMAMDSLKWVVLPKNGIQNGVDTHSHTIIHPDGVRSQVRSRPRPPSAALGADPAGARRPRCGTRLPCRRRLGLRLGGGEAPMVLLSLLVLLVSLWAPPHSSWFLFGPPQHA